MKRKEIWVKLIFILMVCSLFSYNFFNYNTNLEYKKDFLKTSDNEISIVTPENKTYSAPMSGYYPATYGFENDDDGSDPEGWILNKNPPNFEIEVVSEKQGHKKVVHFYDNENAWRSMNHYPDGNPTTGTIELWVFGVDVKDYRFDIGLWDTAVRQGFVVIIADDKWQYWDAGYHDVSNVGIPQDNTWHHLRIDFRCAGAPSYQGLSMASYKIFVDGIESGEIPFWEPNTNHLERLSIGTDAAPNSEWWVDAIGFSWDPNYNIGDNLNEGLLLSFDNSTTLDWMGYSLDGLTNKTILGNAVIPLPEEGSHQIQVFGNDTSGKLYESLVRYFSYFYFEIITPEDKIYTEPMLGYYPATYGFENDIIGYNPSGWQVNENPPAYDIDVVKEKNSHKHVVHINDNEIGGYRMRYFPDSDIEIGTIELWVLGVNVSDTALEISSLDNSSITGITLRLHTNGWYYYGKYGDQLISNASIPQDNQWHHIRLDFRCSGTADYMGLTESSYRVYIDGINLGELSFCEPYFDKLNSFIITTDNISDSEWWVDAIGFSWDPNYNIGDNLNEGLLLSFETHLSLNWIGYSLDGQANKTIQGNKTIPLPENGLHKIQFYCELPTGELIESNVRHFTINYNSEEPYIPPYELPNDFHILITVFIGALSIFLGVLLILYVILSRRRKYELYKFKEPKKPEIRVKPKSGYLICPYCHNENSIKNNYCIYCGASLLEFKPDNI